MEFSCTLTSVSDVAFLQLLMFQKRLSGEPFGLSVLGLFVIIKTTFLTVTHLSYISCLDVKDMVSKYWSHLQ
jgi:hypothetical protein